MTAKLKRQELDRIVAKHYVGSYGEHQNDIDILLTNIEALHNQKMTLLERLHKIENPNLYYKEKRNANASR